MRMYVIAFWIIIIFQIICGLWNLLKSILFYKKFKQYYEMKKINMNDTTKNELVIVIPCLREQDIIWSTIDYFLNIIENNQNIKIVIVTTEKEEYEKQKSLTKIKLLINDIVNNENTSVLANKYNELISIKDIIEIRKYRNDKDFDKIVNKKITEKLTTSQIVEKYLEQKDVNNVIHIHYPKTTGIMADQLNYVLRNYDFKNKNKTYFSVYNADSLPGENTFENAFKTISIDNNPKVMQQYSYAYSNINDLSFIMKGLALYQSNFEIKYGLVNSIILSEFLYTYVVGHGMYIRVDVLEELGGFDSHFWCEDIFISSVLRNKKIGISPIYSLENMETPRFLNIQIKQNAVWFKTSNQWIKMIKANLKFKNKLSFSSINWFIQRIRMNLSWLLVPILILYSLIYTILIKNYKLFFLALCSYLFMQILTYFTTLFIIEKIENKKIDKKLISFISVVFSTFISNLGPLYSLFNIKMKKYKTVR